MNSITRPFGFEMFKDLHKRFAKRFSEMSANALITIKNKSNSMDDFDDKSAVKTLDKAKAISKLKDKKFIKMFTKLLQHVRHAEQSDVSCPGNTCFKTVNEVLGKHGYNPV